MVEAKKTKPKSTAVEKAVRQEVVETRFLPPPLMPPSIRDLMELGAALAKSRMFPNINTPEAAVAVIEYGRELNIPPVVSCQTIYLVKGRLGMMAQLMQALLERDGVTITVLEKTRERCRLKFEKPGKKPFEEEFTAGDATRMNLANKDNYQKTPEEMYYCRCLTKGGRVFNPSSWLGLYSVVELQDDYIADVTPEEESKDTKEEERGQAEGEDTPTIQITDTPLTSPVSPPPPKAEVEEVTVEESEVEGEEEKDPNGKLFEEEEKPEEELGGEQVIPPTSEQLAKLSELIAWLADYGIDPKTGNLRDEKGLKKDMAIHLKKEFDTAIKPDSIPVELDQDECVNLIGCLEASVKLAEEQKEKTGDTPKEEAL